MHARTGSRTYRACIADPARRHCRKIITARIGRARIGPQLYIRGAFDRDDLEMIGRTESANEEGTEMSARSYHPRELRAKKIKSMNIAQLYNKITRWILYIE